MNRADGPERQILSGKICGTKSRGRQRTKFTDSLNNFVTRKESPNNELIRRTDDREEGKAMIADVCFFFCLFGWFLNVLISRTGPKTERLTILRAATHETELGDHVFCLSRSHYTDTDPTSRERAATAGIEPGTSSPGVARSTDWATPPPPPMSATDLAHDDDDVVPLFGSERLL